MQLTNLDTMVRRSLLERGLPLHYYSEILFHQSSAIRELSKDTLQIVNAVNLALNDYGAADLPSDFVDDVMVGQEAGALLQPIPKRSNINPLRVHDTTTGEFVAQTNQNVSTLNQTYYNFAGTFNWFWNVSDYGEPTGRYFGAPGGVSYGYEIIRSRRQIQFVGAANATNVILLYISNGQSIDNATQIDWRAMRAIQTYSDWQRSPNAAIDKSPEAMSFWNARRLLRAEMNELTVEDVKNVVRNGYKATIKS